MSHYIYRKKIFAETSDGFILPFACCSDSSMTTGRRGMRHPEYWSILNLGFNHLFVKRDEWAAAAAAEYARQIRLLTEHYAEFYPGETVTENSVTYYGTSFPGGRKLKNMRAFFSIRRTVPFEDFLQKHMVSITLDAKKTTSWDSYETIEIPLSSEEKVSLAEKEHQRLLAKYPDAEGIFVEVNGL